MATTGKVPPPLKPKPKIPPKKNINLNTLEVSSSNYKPAPISATKTPSKSFEPEDDETPAEFISSLRGGLRKTNRDWSSFEKNEEKPEPKEVEKKSMEEDSKAPIIKPKPIADTKETQLPPPDASHLDNSPVRLPGMTRARSSTASSIDSIAESTTSSSRFPSSAKYKQLLNKGLNKSTETFNKSYAKSSEKLDTFYKKIPKSSDQLDQLVKRVPNSSGEKMSKLVNKIPGRKSKISSTPEITDEEEYEEDEEYYNKHHRKAPATPRRAPHDGYEEDENYQEKGRSGSTSKEKFEHFYKKIPRSSDQLDQLVGSSSDKFNKMVKKIPRRKSKTTTSTPEFSDEELSADDTHSHLPVRKTASPRKSSRPGQPSIVEPSDHYDDDDDDDDAPPLPQRPRTAPYVSKSKPKPKPKPIIPNKPKPTIPSNKPLLNEQSLPTPRSNLTPPAPPKSRSRTASVSTHADSNATSPEPSLKSPVPPPPPKSRTRPQAPPPRSSPSTTGVSPPATATSWKEVALDLELDSQWYTSEDSSKFPKDLQNLDYFTSFGFMGKKQFKIYSFRLKDLSTVKLKLVWDKDSSDPSLSLEHELKFIAPPTPTKELLLQGNAKYGEHVANWCETKIGTKVGNGECWTLAHDALQISCGKHAFVSSGLQHGALLTTLVGVEKKGVVPKVVNEPVTDDIKRGDILQFKDCGFRYPNKALYFGSPDHTSIVLHVETSPDDSKFKKLSIIHQNFNGHKIVDKEEIELDKLMEGELKVFRPVDASWIPSLEQSLLSL